MPSKSAARILIVDDHAATRTAIRELLNWHSFNICGEATDGDVAVEKVIQLKPDIVLLDISMPRMNGVNAAYEIGRLRPKAKIVFLTTHDSRAVAIALGEWADGFVRKADAGIDLVPTLKRLGRNSASKSNRALASVSVSTA